MNILNFYAEELNIVKRYRFLPALLAGTCLYALVSVSLGKDGLWALRQMKEQKRLLSTRTEQIQGIYNSLDLERTALEHDGDVIAAFARKLGFVEPGEKLVKLNGLASEDEFLYNAGTPLKAGKIDFVPEWFCKASAILLSLVVYLFLLMKDLSSGEISFRRRPSFTSESFVHGVPVYDLPQV